MDSEDEDNDMSMSRADQSFRDSSFRGIHKQDSNIYSENQSDMFTSTKSGYLSKQKKMKMLKNALNDFEQDINDGLESRKRSRGSTTDEKKSMKSTKYKLRFDKKKYTAQKEKVIEARKAKFGIFKKTGPTRPVPNQQESIRDDQTFNQSDTASMIDSVR